MGIVINRRFYIIILNELHLKHYVTIDTLFGQISEGEYMNIKKAIAIIKNGVNAKNYEEQVEAHQIAIQSMQIIEKEPVDRGYLDDWYVSSVSELDTPVWTTEHLDELFKDFILIPKDDD